MTTSVIYTDWRSAGQEQLVAFNRSPSLCFSMPGAPNDADALAKLAAAGESIDALSMAIQQAAQLDEHPGEARQKLRGALF